MNEERLDVRAIYYKGGYKYQLHNQYTLQTGIRVPTPIITRFFTLQPEGHLIIRPGYAWDGPSGPTFDTLSFMRGSLVHDVFYQMFREGLLPPQIFRKAADQLLHQICLEDGMWKVRAWWVYKAVRIGAPRYEEPDPKPVMIAPKRKKEI